MVSTFLLGLYRTFYFEQPVRYPQRARALATVAPFRVWRGLQVPAVRARLVEFLMTEKEGFEPSRELLTPYTLSRRAPSATRSPLLLYYLIKIFISLYADICRCRLLNMQLHPRFYHLIKLLPMQALKKIFLRTPRLL